MKLHPILRWLLWPFSLLYGAAVVLRAWLYAAGIFRQKRLDAVVISVGNLTVGGTGKTPMVLWLAERLKAAKRKLGILTRGYAGFGFHGRKGPAGQLDYHEPPRIHSDEVALLHRRLFPTDEVFFGVGADRYSRGQMLHKLGVSWFLLDDGFQHLRLARDVDILMIDSTDPFAGGQLLPAGRLREPKRALTRAGIIVITRSEHAPALEAVIRRFTACPLFYATMEFDEVYAAMGKAPAGRVDDWREKRFFAFCAVGNPSAFFSDLNRWGFSVVGQAVFRDHHVFTEAEAESLERQARAAGADALLCTEKDILNLVHARFNHFSVCYCRASLRVVDGEKLWSTVEGIIERKRGGGAR